MLKKDSYGTPTIAYYKLIQKVLWCSNQFWCWMKRYFAIIRYAEEEENFKTIITSNWNVEMSSHAAYNLHLNKWIELFVHLELKLLTKYFLQSICAIRYLECTGAYSCVSTPVPKLNWYKRVEAYQFYIAKNV